MDLQDHECLGVANTFKNLVMMFPSQCLSALPESLNHRFLDKLKNYTCAFGREAALEEEVLLMQIYCSNYTPTSKKMGYTVLAHLSINLSAEPSVTNIFAATMHHSHFQLGMVLWLGLLHGATEFRSASYLLPVLRLGLFFDIPSVTNILWHFLAFMHHSHFKLEMVLQLGSYMSLTEFRSTSYLLADL